MSDLGGVLEYCLVAMFALGIIVLEWQGRRLDRKRAEREAAQMQAPTSAASGTATSPARSASGSDRAT
ncbi:hypothetical protein ACO1M3_13965, partial [Staphylococcus aureus]